MTEPRAKIVGLFGGAPTDAGGEPSVIGKLEEALEQARRGEIIAIGLVLIRPNFEIGTIARNPRGNRHLLVAGCEYLKNDIINADESMGT